MQSLEQSTFIAFDLETTGFLPIAQRIIQVSAVKFDLQGTVYEEFDQFIDPQIPIPADASKVHKIYDEHVRGKPTIKEVLPMFKDFIGEDSILLAHNSEFDTGFLGAYYILQDEVMPENQIWDTLSISRALVKNIMNHKLETLVHHFGFDAGTFHRAIDDSIYVMKVFKKFCSLVNNSYPDMLQIAGERRFSDAKSLFSIQLPLSLMKLKKAATKKAGASVYL
jgi:DNA polymerase III epsilon subunit family exonuclease